MDVVVMIVLKCRERKNLVFPKPGQMSELVLLVMQRNITVNTTLVCL